MPQATVSRIEREVVSPSVDTLEKLLRECGKELDVVDRPSGEVDVTLITERLHLTPGQRARAAVREWHDTEPFRRIAERARRT
jgi:transcriptional regulator with XRE-family HTH domain